MPLSSGSSSEKVLSGLQDSSSQPPPPPPFPFPRCQSRPRAKMCSPSPFFLPFLSALRDHPAIFFFLDGFLYLYPILPTPNRATPPLSFGPFLFLLFPFLIFCLALSMKDDYLILRHAGKSKLFFPASFCGSYMIVLCVSLFFFSLFRTEFKEDESPFSPAGGGGLLLFPPPPSSIPFPSSSLLTGALRGVVSPFFSFDSVGDPHVQPASLLFPFFSVSQTRNTKFATSPP